MGGLFDLAKMIKRDTGGDREIKTVDLTTLGDKNWSSELGEFGGEAGSFVTEDERMGLRGGF